MKCHICGKEFDPVECEITCSDRCARIWLKRTEFLYTLKRAAEKKREFCPHRGIYLKDKLKYGVACLFTQREYSKCSRCSWNPTVEKRRIENGYCANHKDE